MSARRPPIVIVPAPAHVAVRAPQITSAGLAYARAVVSDRAREPMATDGHRLYWMTDTCFAFVELPATRDGFVIVGRNDGCGARITDPSVDERQLLVRSTILDDGCLLLRVLDLDTRIGFSVGGERMRAISATGPLVFGVGGYAFVALPSGPGADRHPDELPALRVRPSRAARPANVHVLVPRAMAAPRPGARLSDVLVMPGPVMIAEASAARRANARGYELAFESKGSFSSGASERAGELEGARPRDPSNTKNQRVVLRLASDDLDHGVFVGRDRRACVPGLAEMLHLQVSRIHLFIVREQDEIVVYDIASLNGTWVDRERIRAATLDPAGTEIYLGTTPGIRLFWSAL